MAIVSSLEARIWEARVALQGVPDYRYPLLANARDLIERGLRRIDEALYEAHALPRRTRDALPR